MKDLTAYFGSPAKESITPENQVSASDKIIEQTSEKQPEIAEEGSTNTVNNKNVKIDAKKKRKSRKNKLRKHSDPVVKSITELMSNNLSLISPNSSTSENKIDSNDLVDAEVKHSSNESTNAKTSETEGSDKSEPSINMKIRDSSDKFIKTESLDNEDCNKSDIEIQTETKDSSNMLSTVVIHNVKSSSEPETIGVKTNGDNESSLMKIDCESSSSSDSQGKTKVVNAFKFLMDSRFKTIGSNTPGKEVDKETSDDGTKEKLSARKHLLSDWAEKKGASKRKREEEDRDVIISYKLEKRAKRLKNLLKAKTDNDDQVKIIRKHIRKISTDTESSNDATVKSEDTINLNNKAEKLDFTNSMSFKESTHREKQPMAKKNNSKFKNDISDNACQKKNKKSGKIISKSTSSQEENDSSKADLSNILLNKEVMADGTSNKKNRTQGSDEDNTSSSVPTLEIVNEQLKDDVVDVSKNKKVRNRGKDTKDNILETITLNRKLKLDNIEKENENNRAIVDILDETAQDVEICRPKPEGRQSLLNFFGVINKSDNTKVNETTSKNPSNEKISKENNVKRIKSDAVSEEYDTNTINSDKSKTLFDMAEEEFIPTTHTTTTETEETSTCDHVLPDTLQTRKRKKSKKHKKTQEEKNPKVQKIVDESTQENELTPRRLRSWRMKIRIQLDEGTNENNKTSKIVQKETIIDENSCDGDTKDSDVVSLSSGSDFEDEIKTKKPLKKALKVAPVFVKAAPKPKIDPDVLEARKQFLMSGIPDTLKKCLGKQQSFEERDYDVFPTISHIQQKCNSNLWNLPESDLKLVKFSPIKLDNFDFTHCLPATKNKNLNIKVETDKITELKSVLNKIKTENPNYPVLKAFRQISERKEKRNNDKEAKNSKIKNKIRKKRKSLNKSVEIVEPEHYEIDIVAQAMWTEKYKPRNSDDIIGNTEAIKSLKKWLEAWWNFSEEIINSKSKRRNSNSSDDFVVSDCSSRDTIRLPGNTVVLEGPCGSGKSTAVYAICNELGFNVIEVNASSKRTGKHLLQKLQEATQSHQVHKKESSSFMNFLQQTDNQESVNKKMCVLLVEDIDIVFEQDDNFLPALMQLITTSKRPIIVTTTDYESVFVQRSLSGFERISFMPLSAQSSAVWLQLLCLVEGMLVDQDHIGGLLEFNKGDVRRTLLALQFWVQSGGEIVKSDMPIKIDFRRSSAEEKLVGDDFSNEKRKARNIEKVVTHKNCIRSFEILDGSYDFSVPYHLKLGLLWWNFSRVLNIPDFSESRINRLKAENKVTQTENLGDSPEDRLKLSELSKLYDTVCVSDILFRKTKIADSSEPIIKNFKYDTKDSIELGDKIDDEVLDSDFVHEMSHYLVNGQIQRFKRVYDGGASLNMAVPDRRERRWRAKHFMCEDLFKGALSSSTSLDRKAVAMDYMPTMRCISRSENDRAAHNTKRGNRFRNYLRNLVANCSDSTFKLACNILRE